MKRRDFLIRSAIASAASLSVDKDLNAQEVVTKLAPANSQLVAPGVWKLRFGTPEQKTPVTTRTYPMAVTGWDTLPSIESQPVTIDVSLTTRGCHVEVPLAPGETVHGLGLQMYSMLQRGKKKTLRVNADPHSDSGDTHAPVPFYVTNRGYGIYIDTARYATFYCGSQHRKEEGTPYRQEAQANASAIIDALPAAYQNIGMGKPSSVLVEIPDVKGIDVYVFGGPAMLQAVQRYNLFSGGGVLPPRWGLGVWYRVKIDYTQDDVLKMAAELREEKMPCDVIGLEPGWQTHSYPCTYVWSKNFPEPKAMISQLADDHYRVNLWEHAFTDRNSPIHTSLISDSADHEVWSGLVPDFLQPSARKTFADFHYQEHVSIGVSGYKLDECDNSDFTGSWSFPETSLFPSGVDGEQMHSLFGLRYAGTIQEAFERRQQRTYGLIRCAHALATPYPYVLYSDLYDHRIFICALANSGFSGLLWTPEVRDALNPEELIRRLQSVVFSPVALINAWYIRNPPWKQVNREANNEGRLDPNWKDVEATCREVLNLRMKLIPYLHAAFARYFEEGIPPFRALVLDFPHDPETWNIADQFLVGGELMVAPIFAGETKRKIYLPDGQWFDFWTEKLYEGKQSIVLDARLEHIPLFVKSGSILPLAQVTSHSEDPMSWKLEARVYGHESASTAIYEEDGEFKPKLNRVTLQWDASTAKGTIARTQKQQKLQYEVDRWNVVTDRGPRT